MKTINQHLKEKTFKPVYLLIGSETYLKKTFKNKLKEGILSQDDGLNFSYFEGKKFDQEEAVRMAHTMPFFAEKRLIIFENTGLFKSASESILNMIANLPETTCVVFVEEEMDKRSKLYKAVTKIGYVSEMCTMDMGSLVKWVSGIVAKEQVHMSSSVIQYMIQKIGFDMENITLELEKVICYTAGQETITKEHIDEICSEHITNKIFDMITAIGEKNTKQALKLYKDLLILKEPSIKILVLITRQFNYLLQVKELIGKMSEREIASKLKIQPFIVGKYSKQAKNFTKSMLREAFETCVETDESIKTGKIMDRIGVELLIVKYSG